MTLPVQPTTHTPVEPDERTAPVVQRLYLVLNDATGYYEVHNTAGVGTRAYIKDDGAGNCTIDDDPDEDDRPLFLLPGTTTVIL